MNFEWDDRKAAENLKKHKVSFEEAIGVFYDPKGFDRFDEEHSSSAEDRFHRIGHSAQGRLLIVAYTDRKEATRIISARKMKPKEREIYGKNIRK